MAALGGGGDRPVGVAAVRLRQVRTLLQVKAITSSLPKGWT